MREWLHFCAAAPIAGASHLRGHRAKDGSTFDHVFTHGGWAVITGASSGIGLEFARTAAAAGARLALGGRRAHLLAERKNELLEMGSPEVVTIQGDLNDESTLDRFLNHIGTNGCDFLCNNAGYGVDGSVAVADADALIALQAVLTTIPVRLALAAAPGMIARGRGAIVNVGSLAGNAAVPGAAMYVASKAFLERFSESIALELREHGIVVQALCPGYVTTDFHREVQDDRALRKNRGLIRWMNPRDVVSQSVAQLRRTMHKQARNRRWVPSRRNLVVIPGFWNRMLFLLSRVIPRRIAYRAALARKQGG